MDDKDNTCQTIELGQETWRHRFQRLNVRPPWADTRLDVPQGLPKGSTLHALGPELEEQVDGITTR